MPNGPTPRGRPDMGPLADLKIVELAGIGPGPMAATVLADMGATVLRIDRTVAADLGTPKGRVETQLLRRSRQEIALDLKHAPSVELVLELVAQADVLIEGFRPGVTERLGLGPDVCLARNPRLVYGRITGWGAVLRCVRVPGWQMDLDRSDRSPLPSRAARTPGPARDETGVAHGSKPLGGRSFVEVAGVRQPMPAPRFSRTPSGAAGPAGLDPAGSGRRERLAAARSGSTSGVTSR
jgi:hypothetical protein